MTRGINEQVEARWKVFMQSQMFWFKQEPLLKDEKGNFIEDGVDENGNKKYKAGPATWTKVQGALRPIQLWEYAFPEETMPYNSKLPYNTQTLPQILAMMNLHKTSGESQRPEVNAPIWALRKLMHLSKVPSFEELKKHEFYEITPSYIAGTEAVAVYPIGIRKDPVKDYFFTEPDGRKVGFRQEGI